MSFINESIVRSILCKKCFAIIVKTVADRQKSEGLKNEILTDTQLIVFLTKNREIIVQCY